MKLSKVLLVMSAVFALTAPAAARAQAEKFYAGGSVGQGSVNFCGAAPAGVSCDDKSVSWKFLVGAQLHPNIAVELGYGRLGEVNASGPGGSLAVEAKALEVVAVGSYPITQQVHPFLKLGGYRGQTKFSSTVGLGADESNTDITWGLGVRFDLTPKISVRAEFQRYTDVGGPTIGKDDVDVLGVGILFRF